MAKSQTITHAWRKEKSRGPREKSLNYRPLQRHSIKCSKSSRRPKFFYRNSLSLSWPCLFRYGDDLNPGGHRRVPISLVRKTSPTHASHGGDKRHLGTNRSRRTSMSWRGDDASHCCLSPRRLSRICVQR